MMNIDKQELERMSNTDWITELMNFHPSGPLVQSFVIEALRFYARMVAQQDPKNFQDEEKQFINPNAWRSIGIDVFNQVLLKYGATEQDQQVLALIKTINKRLLEEKEAREEEERKEKELERENRPKYSH